jgi:murein hydrolase activator
LYGIGHFFMILIISAIVAAAPLHAQTQAPVSLTQESSLSDFRKLELEAIENGLKDAEANRSRLKSEIDAISMDRARLSARLNDVAKRVQQQEAKVSDVEQRLKLLGETETALRKSLDERRGLLSYVLASLQRMGRKPPPAILVKPEDMLEALHAALLVGSVLPDLQGEAQSLVSDLGELVRLRDLGRKDRDMLQNEWVGLVRDRQELSGLMEARQNELRIREKGLNEEQRKSEDLIRKAQNLRDVLAQIENDEDIKRRQAALSTDPKARELGNRLAAVAGRDPSRLAPGVGFAALRGSLPWPVSGQVLRGFNANDGQGGQLRGMALGTRPAAVVTAPADGTVAYAGIFRGYGQLLIINVGNGYYILLAGMDKITVSTGQVVITGEPVAQMGQEARAILAVSGDDAGRPVLYVEFRKDGISIDPAPWWASPLTEKVRG